MNISTRDGDDGKTLLRHGERVSKSHPRVQANGGIEELSATLGLAYSHLQNQKMRSEIRKMQEQLLLISHELLTFGTRNALRDSEREILPQISQQHLDYLDTLVLDYENCGFNLSGWVFPGQTQADAFLHQARAVTRRVERIIQVTSEAGEPCSHILKSYINRLSDLLWLMAAYCAERDDGLSKTPFSQ